jgi:methylglutaconyl-CoA hydratase
MAVVADNASFAVSEAKFGILPAVIGPYVVNAVGKRNARYLALTTTRIDAATALSMGMVQRVVSAEALDAEVDRVVAELVAGGPQAQIEIKQLMDQLSVSPVSDQVRELTAGTISRVRGTDEAREGFAAFLGKRPAKWIPQ